MKSLMVCLLVFISAVSAEPLFLSNSTLWDEKTHFIIGNCKNACPYCQMAPIVEEDLQNTRWLDLIGMGAPQTRSFEHLKGYVDFQYRHQQRALKFFGLWGGGIAKNGQLFSMDSRGQLEQKAFNLNFPITEGALNIFDVYFENHWHTFLVALVKNDIKKESMLFVFDVTDPNKPLELFIKHSLPGFVAEITKPNVVRLNNGCFGIAVIGSAQEQGSIEILLFNQAKTTWRFAVGGNHLSGFVAVDLQQRGIVDRIYVSGAGQLWALTIHDFYQVSVKKLITTERIVSPIVIPEVAGLGTRIYFMGQLAKQEGLFMVQDNLSQELTPNSCVLIKEGNFSGFFIRFGYLLLVPEDASIKPYVLSLPFHQLLPMDWQPLYVDKGLLNDKANLIKILWDPKQQKEVLCILNSSCQLNILSGVIKTNKNGRVLWRLRPF